MEAKDIKNLLDIADLDTSAKLIFLVNEILSLEVKMKALSAIVEATTKIDTYALEAAIEHEYHKPEVQQKMRIISECGVALSVAKNNPEARLKAMFKARAEGRY